jgi:hypothetical protein
MCENFVRHKVGFGDKACWFVVIVNPSGNFVLATHSAVTRRCPQFRVPDPWSLRYVISGVIKHKTALRYQGSQPHGDNCQGDVKSKLFIYPHLFLDTQNFHLIKTRNSQKISFTYFHLQMEGSENYKLLLFFYFVIYFFFGYQIISLA